VKWIIVSCNYGRLGNRLHTHANILAWCIANDYNLSNLSFRSYSNLFENQRHHSSDSYFKSRNLVLYLMKLTFICTYIERLILSKKWLRRLSFFFHIIEKDNFSTLKEQELDSIKTNKIIIINAWDIRCPKSMKLVGQLVRKLLRPASCYVKPASDFIKSLIKHYDCLIGIHARRGDYKNYLGGKHFHSWESYKNWIMEVKNVLEKQGYNKIGFVLCSDEKPPKCFQKIEGIHYKGGKHYITDLHILSLCNYNIGPPSSFGTWASWHGKIPRCVLTKDTNIRKLENFILSF
jgi:hypothetical protein